jgi:Phosphatidylserine/phosphatidylglycerophosphate/cardiolipin synthases and related enzymes
VELLTAPGNAESRLVERINAADRRVCVIIPNAGGTKTALVQAAIRAASRGVSVTMLLSDAWYHSEDNAALTSALRQTSPAQSGNLTVKVADPRGRYGKIHAKGVVIDDTVVVGSLNWNDHSATNNREVVAVVESHELAEYFATAFGADWRGGSRLLPVGVAGWFLCVVGGAAWLGYRTITFESH